MKKFALTIAVCASLVGCGAADRFAAQVTGVAESCHEGVAYLQFASGATVKYLPSGQIATCR